MYESIVKRKCKSIILNAGSKRFGNEQKTHEILWKTTLAEN